MKALFPTLVLLVICGFNTIAQEIQATDRDKQALTALIDSYSKAREMRDTVLLKKILTNDIDQLVSNGEWRSGMKASTKGMMNSSASNPGTRTLTVERIKMISGDVAVVDCRYEIKNNDGAVRKMWSSFVAVRKSNTWKISAIRNMLPAPN